MPWQTSLKEGFTTSPTGLSCARALAGILEGRMRVAGEHSLRAFEGKQIYLPDEVKYRPSGENLGWHYEKFLRVGA